MKYFLMCALLGDILSLCVPSQCPFCSAAMEEIKAARLQVIQQEILDKLGLPFAPNVTNTHMPKIPPLLRLLESTGLQDPNYGSSRSDEDNYHARTHRIIMFPEKAPELMQEYPKKCCFFSFREKSDRLKITNATLDVYVKRNISVKTRVRKATLKLYKRKFPIWQGIPERELVASKPVRYGGWQHFKIKRLVKAWQKTEHTNLGIDIELEGVDDSSFEVVVEGDETKQPFLELYTRDRGNKRRAKRKVGLDCEQGSLEKKCCRFELVVDFPSFGWDWIIAPKQFQAYYCIGECQDTMLPRYPHAHLVNKVKGKSACCTPNKMGPITMLYFDQSQKIMLADIPSMVAESCGCA